MSGIAGIYHIDGWPVEHADLECLAEALAHRGQDGVRHLASRFGGFGAPAVMDDPGVLPGNNCLW